MKKFIFFTIILIYLVFSYSPDSSAQTVTELQNQISNTNSEISKLDREIKSLSNKIAVTSQEKNTLSNAIKALTLSRDKLIKERTQTEKKITATGLVIKTLNNEIDSKTNTVNNARESLAILLNNLHQKDNVTFIEKLFSVNNFGEFSREYNNIVQINTDIKENIESLSVEKMNLSITKDSKEAEKNALDQLKNSLNVKAQEIIANKKEKDSLLSATKNKESEYKKLLLDTQKRKEAFEKEIENFEAQIKFILNPKSIPQKGTAVFSWPVNYVLITSPYGSRWGRFHYGLDFRAAVGTRVNSMGSGVVMGTGDTDIACKGASFGKWVFIKYNNGLSSTYGHLSSITTKVGTIVKAGDQVGLSGNTGSSTGPHLHVAVYASDGVKVDTVPSKSCNGKIFTQPISALSAYLDPADYLPTITASMVKK